VRKVMVATTAADSGRSDSGRGRKRKRAHVEKGRHVAAMKNCPEIGAISGCWGRANGTRLIGGASRRCRPLRFG